MTRRNRWLMFAAIGVGFYVVSKRKAETAAAVAAASALPPASSMSTAVSPTNAPTTANMQALADYDSGLNGTIEPGFLPTMQRQIDLRRAAAMDGLGGTITPGYLPMMQRQIDLRRAAAMDGLAIAPPVFHPFLNRKYPGTVSRVGGARTLHF